MTYEDCCDIIFKIMRDGTVVVDTPESAHIELPDVGTVFCQSNGLYKVLIISNSDEHYVVNHVNKTAKLINRTEENENQIKITDSERFTAVVLRLAVDEENSRKFIEDYIKNPLMARDHNLTYHISRLSYIKEIYDFVGEESEE